MPLEARLLTGLALSVAAAYLVTPLAIRLANQLAFFDRPAGYKGHTAPTPYLGGAAVVAAFIAVLALVAPHDGRTLAVIGGVTVMWAVGTTDDRRTLAPGIRVAIEAGLAAGLWLAGFGWEPSGIAPVDLFVTIAWTLAVVNAFNLFDNMDGATGSLTVVVGTGLAALGVIEGSSWLALAGIALAGACLGFLPHNLSSPAKIFLGDGGSMPIGFAVAAITMAGAGELVPGWTGLLVALLLVAVPAADTALVIVSRRRRGISVLTGGRDHLTHRTRSRVGSPHATAAVLGGVQALVSALAIIAARGGPGVAAVGVAAFLATAGGAIAVLDREYIRDSDAVSSPPPPAWLQPVLLGPIGLGLGLSPFADGYYNPSIWIPIATGLLVIVVTALVGSRLRLRAPGWMLVGGIALLAAVTLLSSLWSPSAHEALVAGNRYVLYAALAGVLVLALTSRSAAAWLFGGIVAGGVAVGLWVVFSMLGGGGDLFVAGRLHEPLGYINGEGSFFVLALWICLGAAESRARPVVAGLGMAGTTLFSGLAVLSQSRGVALALLGSALVVFAVLPGRVRRFGVVFILVAFVAVTWSTLTGVFEAHDAATAKDAARTAAVVILFGAVALGVVWGVACEAFATTRPGPGAVRLNRACASVAVGLVVVGLAVAAVDAGPLRSQVRTQWHAFTHLDPAGQPSAGAARTRLVTGGGNRYEYWRVGFDSWRAAPLAGNGAGSFISTWYRKRRITEDIRQPHSLAIEVAGGSGLLGLAGLAIALAGVGLGAARRRRDVHDSPLARGLVVAAVGMFSAWAIHTQVDWMHLLPGVTGIGLAGGAWLAATRGDGSGNVSWAVRGVLLALVFAATVLVVRQGIADHERDTARNSLASDPTATLREARRSLDFDPTSVESRWLEAAALARFDAAGPADATLRKAVREEPENFVTWTLIGDLATRRGRRGEALRAYRRAHALNPLDAGLRASVRRSSR